MAGFEGADHRNGKGEALDINRANGHRAHCAADYARLRELNLLTARETIGWRQFEADPAGQAAAVRTQVAHAQQHGIQLIWSLFHYGWPPELDPFRRPEEFVSRFADHCGRVTALVAGNGQSILIQPINEISFLAWAATHTGLIFPYEPGAIENGSFLKRVLVTAALRAMDAIRLVAPNARFLHTDPVVYVTPPEGAGADVCASAMRAHEAQFEAWDMLCGMLAPELGGAPHYLDVVGINYYHDNQWEHGTHKRLHWHLGDRRRRPFAELAASVQARYCRPICIAETSHVGDGRAAWMDHMGAEIEACRQRGVALHGVCLYPVIDRPDWENSSHWHQSGLWDVPAAAAGDFTRVLCEPYAVRLKHWQSVLLEPSPTTPPPVPSIMKTIVAFSHLRWDFVYQRPQHLLSRLAQDRPVVFIEEPIGNASEPRLEQYAPCPGVTVLRMHVAGPSAGFDDRHMAALEQAIGTFLIDNQINEYLLWFYTPMAYPLSRNLSPAGMVYDCMDELAAFDFAPAALIEREDALFGGADLVFTGGLSLYDAKRGRHPDVHCFPSSVDHAHFGQKNLADHPDQGGLRRPRLGYYGVIDERLDLGLIQAVATAHPEWELVMVGPTAKIDPAALPQLANIHWMGPHLYNELPSFLAGWDVCLMPFALNASTRFISPTKTLEYLAAGRPVVSTAVPDVVRQYASVVAIARSPDEFIRACETILEGGDAEQRRFEITAKAISSATSWDRTAGAIATLLERFDELGTAPSLPEDRGASAPVIAPSVIAEPT